MGSAYTMLIVCSAWVPTLPLTRRQIIVTPLIISPQNNFIDCGASPSIVFLVVMAAIVDVMASAAS